MGLVRFFAEEVKIAIIAKRGLYSVPIMYVKNLLKKSFPFRFLSPFLFKLAK